MKHHPTHHCNKPIAFPDAKVFDDLFVRDLTTKDKNAAPLPFYLHDEDVSYQRVEIARRRGYEWVTVRKQTAFTVPVGPRLWITGHNRSHEVIYVKPNPEVEKYITDNMIPVMHDEISYEITVWDDGRGLVSTRYSQILGNRYLGIIDVSSIPNPLTVVSANDQRTTAETVGG